MQDAAMPSLFQACIGGERLASACLASLPPGKSADCCSLSAVSSTKVVVLKSCAQAGDQLSVGGNGMLYRYLVEWLQATCCVESRVTNEAGPRRWASQHKTCLLSLSRKLTRP